MSRTMILAGAMLFCVVACADEKVSEELEQLNDALRKEIAAFKKKLKEAETEAEEEAIKEKNPGPAFAEKYLSFARKHRKDAEAMTALTMAMGLSGGPQNKDGAWGRILKAIERDHLERPEIAGIVRDLSGSGDEASVALLKGIMSKNPNVKIQARACKGLRDIHRERVEAAEPLKNDDTLRKNVEKARGKEYVEKMLAQAETSAAEVGSLNKLLEGKYDGHVIDLRIGKAVPEVVSQDLQGKKVKLSDLKGKVVVLDFWATWCPPCKAMIPHTRKLVARHKDDPFVFVSISGDDDRKEVQDFIKKTPMPWTHWYNGPQGGVLADWEIEAFPTVIVVDAKGIIRFKDLREDDLDAAVAKLLKETKK